MTEWVESPLSQLATFQKGRKVDTSPFNGDGYAPYLGASGLGGGDDGFAAARLAVIAKSTDTLMLWDGERSGLVGYGRQGVVASTVSKLSPSDKVEPKYLYYALSERFDWIQHRRTGTGVPHVPKDLGRLLKLRYPKQRTIQQRIATILSGIDIAIEKTEALIAKYQQIKAGLMHDLFTRGVLSNGQLRPIESSSSTQFGKIPFGWKLGSILELTDPQRQPILTGPFGADLGNADFVAEGIPVLRIGNVQQGELDLSDLLYVTPRKAALLSRYRIKSGDLLFARQGATTGRNALATKLVDGFLINYHIIRVALDHERCAPLFVEAAFANEVVKRQIERDKGRGTREGINTAQITSLAFPIAPLDEQRQIAQILQKINLQIETTQAELNSYRMRKFGLMHDLLTGKVPVTIENKTTTTEAVA